MSVDDIIFQVALTLWFKNKWEGNRAVAEPFIGQIIAVGFNFVPDSWLACDGTLQPISQYDSLFSLIGTTYGGDGQQTFAVPNMNGRAPASQGQKPGGSSYVIGEVLGSESVTLLSNQVGAHNHLFLASSLTGTTPTPGPTESLAVNAQSAAFLYAPVGANQVMSPQAIGATGQNQPHENRQPFQVLNYIICWAGIYPPRQ